jgi:hypothetical protein
MARRLKWPEKSE